MKRQKFSFLEREKEKNSDGGLAFQILQHTEKSLQPCNYDTDEK